MNDPISPQPEISRLRWRCRRGMRELDVLLERWLDRRWQKASVSERACFERLLAFEDDQLWDWLTGRERPEDADLQEFVERLSRGQRR
ncbi:MAG: succinate dehydrogenase assembly factor 2 [Wenzhouxiangellaceae bacterium]